MRHNPLTSRRVAALCAIAALAAIAFGTDTPGAQASRLAGIAGTGVSAIQILNLDPSQEASVDALFYKQTGAPPVTLTQAGIPPLRTRNIYLPVQSTLASGAYAMVAAADRRISTLTITSWSATGASVAYGDLEPSTAVIVPHVRRHAGGQSSIVMVQNTSVTTLATVTFDLIATESTTPSVSQTFNIAPGTSISLDLASHPSFSNVPAGFVGWVRLTSAIPVAAVAFNDSTQPKAVYAVDGIPASNAATTLVAPFAVAAVGGGTSGISVLNPGTEPVDVAVTYRGAGGTCAGETIAHDSATVAAGAVAVFYQDNVALPVTGRSHLPDGCAAAATITASGPVLAVTNVANTLQGSAAAYSALRPDQAGQNVILPLYRRNFLGSSDVHVVNPSDAVTATVSLEYLNDRAGDTAFHACGSACQVTLAPGAAHRWVFADLGQIPDGSYGLARVVADAPVLATVLDNHAVSGTQANDIAYNGVNAGSGQAAARHVPLALNSFGDPITRTPRPATATGTAPTPTPRPTGTPNPSGVLNLAGMTGVSITNLSPDTAADVTVDFVSQTGNGSASVTRTGVMPGAQTTIFLPAEPGLAEDDVLAARISASQPVAAVAQSQWPATSHMAMYNAPHPATDVVVPWLLNAYAGQTSIVSIQNTDAANGAAVSVAFMPNGQTTPIETLDLPLGPGGATTFSLGTHPRLANLPTGSGSQAGLIWARVTADRPVSVVTTVAQETARHAVYHLAGVPASEAISEGYAPMLFRSYAVDPNDASAGTLTSGVTVLNPGPNPVGVKLTYRGADVLGRSHACAGQTIAHTAMNGDVTTTVAPGALVAFYQGNGALSHLPEGCAASGTLEVTGGEVFAAATVINSVSGSVAGFGILSADLGSPTVHLPIVRRQHTAGLFSSPIQVQNLGDATASVTLHVRNSRGAAINCGADCTATIPSHGSRLWWPSDIAAWPAGEFGDATVTSDQPVAAVVMDMSFNDMFDMTAYRGLANTGHAETNLPLLLNGGRIGDVEPPSGPTPTPTPAAAALGLPGVMPSVVDGRVRMPLAFSAGSHQVSEIELTLDYDQSWLRFDETDGDGDGVPDALVSTLPPAFRVTVEHQATLPRAEISIHVAPRFGDPLTIPNGTWLTLELEVTGKPGPGAGGVGFHPTKGAAMRGPQGQAVPVEPHGGWSPNSRRVAYLPFAQRSPER